MILFFTIRFTTFNCFLQDVKVVKHLGRKRLSSEMSVYPISPWDNFS